MPQINCEYASVRFPIKELLEEIYDKAGEKLELGVHVRTTVKLDKIQEFRKLALEQAKACVGKLCFYGFDITAISCHDSQ